VGGGVNSSEDARNCSVLYICKYFVFNTYDDPSKQKLCSGRKETPAVNPDILKVASIH
jgi:hypothetical protein